MKNLLDGKIAIVTGGNGGIGLGIAEGFAEEGAKVIIASRNKEKNNSAIQKIKNISKDSTTFELDVNNQDSINSLMDFAIKEYGSIDILVNNAGISRRSDEPHLLPKSDWNDVIDTNLNSIHHMTSAVFPHLKKNKSGKIINIGSMMSIFGNANSAAYAASKGGVVQYTKSCAIAWAKYNIQINTILPGWIVTDMTNEFKKVKTFELMILACCVCISVETPPCAKNTPLPESRKELRLDTVAESRVSVAPLTNKTSIFSSIKPSLERSTDRVM